MLVPVLHIRYSVYCDQCNNEIHEDAILEAPDITMHDFKDKLKDVVNATRLAAKHATNSFNECPKCKELKDATQTRNK